MAHRVHAREPSITRRCKDGGSRDLYVSSRRAQRGALAHRRWARKEAARLETGEAYLQATSPQFLKVDVGTARNCHSADRCRFARVAPLFELKVRLAMRRSNVCTPCSGAPRVSRRRAAERSSCASAPGKGGNCLSNRRPGTCSRASLSYLTLRRAGRNAVGEIQTAVADALTPRQRQVPVALVLNGCRSTSWPTVWIRRGARFTRRCAMLAGSYTSTSKSSILRSPKLAPGRPRAAPFASRPSAVWLADSFVIASPWARESERSCPSVAAEPRRLRFPSA